MMNSKINVSSESIHHIRTMIEATGETFNEDLAITYYLTMAQQIANYINESSVPNCLEWLLVEITIRRYGITGQEHTVQDTVGSTSTTYRLNPLAEHYVHLDEYINNRDSRRRVRFY